MWNQRNITNCTIVAQLLMLLLLFWASNAARPGGYDDLFMAAKGEANVIFSVDCRKWYRSFNFSHQNQNSEVFGPPGLRLKNGDGPVLI